MTKSFRAAAAALLLVPALSFAQAKPKPAAKPKKPVATAEAAPEAPKSLADSLEGEAKANYELGKALYRDGDHANAGAKFQAAYESSKDPRLLWNLAANARQQKQFAEARRYVEQYIAASGSTLSERERADATELLTSLERLVAYTVIAVNEAGASIVVDDKPVGVSPLGEALQLDVGSHSLRVSKAGFVEVAQIIELTSNERTKVTVNLVAERHEGRVVVKTSQPNASILLDGHRLGRGSYEGPLPAGVHQLSVNAEGYKDYALDFTLTENAVRRFDVTLEKDNSGVPMWAVVGGGVLLASGLLLGGYFLLRPSDQVIEAPPGNFGPGKVTLPSL